MGAEQSSARADTAGQNTSITKTCYYEVLGLERHATEDEIKKAYRRKALELHPDRNFGDTEAATIKFAEVQSAHQVLSDPQERAWYDSHRESILRGDDNEGEEHFEHNVRLTTASELVRLMGRFSPGMPFTDAGNGFYGILRETFSRLAKEEEAVCGWDGLDFLDYPDFGRENDEYEDVAKPFYSVWTNFSTQKSFSWNDAYRPSDAPDRRVRRLIEKENKRLRDEGIREFNDAVRSLVAFVRKRDPRYVQNMLSEADREKTLREAAAAQRARSKEAYQAIFNKPITKFPGPMDDPEEPEEDQAFSESEESEIEHVECVVCGKIFKSEKQYEAHERSKKHIKAVQQLQREMRKEDKLFNLENISSSSSTVPNDELEQLKLEPNHNPPRNTEEDSTFETGIDEHEEIYTADPSDVDKPLEARDTDDYATRRDVENRLLGRAITPPVGAASFITVDSGSEAEPKPKMGKAKAKRARKAARQEGYNDSTKELNCVACNESFASKTKLFNHIKEFGHAQPVPKLARDKKKRF